MPRASGLTNIEGCPAEIPITENGKIVAARIWRKSGNDIPELSCNGAAYNWKSGTKFTQGTAARTQLAPFLSIQDAMSLSSKITNIQEIIKLLLQASILTQRRKDL